MVKKAVQTLEFEYWTDPLCIWAYVAQPKLDHVLTRWKHRVEVRYHVVPVFGSIAWRFREGPWAKEGPEGRAAATRRVAQEHGITDVSGECWLSDCPASSWPAGAAVEAVFAMEQDEEIPEGAAGAYLLAMRRRFFVDGQNVTRRQVQLVLAEELDVPRASLEQRLDDGSAIARLHEDYEQKERLRIQGSPTYVFDGGRAMFYGNFPLEVLTATVEKLVDGLDLGGSAC